MSAFLLDCCAPALSGLGRRALGGADIGRRLRLRRS